MATNPNMDEKDLLLRLRDGDELAFEQIYNQYAQRLSIKLVQILKSEELAQDILQDAFTRLWEIRGQIDAELPFSAFLYRIATNMSYNVYQRALKEQIVLKQSYQSESYDHIERHIDNKELNGLLQQALDTLTPRQREVYTLHKVEGLSYKEISEQLHISASAINHHIQEANRQLRIFLRPYHGLLLLMGTMSCVLS